LPAFFWGRFCAKRLTAKSGERNIEIFVEIVFNLIDLDAFFMLSQSPPWSANIINDNELLWTWIELSCPPAAPHFRDAHEKSENLGKSRQIFLDGKQMSCDDFLSGKLCELCLILF